MKKGLLAGMISLAALTGCVKSPKLVVSGSGWNQIVVVDKKSKQIEWKHLLEAGTECNSVVVTPDGNIAYSYSKGARLINKNKEIIWDYKLDKPGETHSIGQLKNGGFLVAASGEPARLIELDRNGKEVRQVTFDGGSKSMHGQFRQVRMSRNGNFLIPLLSKSKVIELDPSGREVAAYPVPAGPFSVMELPKGNLIVSCGDGHFFVEVDRTTGEILRKVDENSFSEKEIMHYVAQINRLKNGNMLLCNWNGHFRQGEEKQIPHLIEFDDNYNIVWKLDDFNNIPRISTSYYIDNGRKLNLKD